MSLGQRQASPVVGMEIALVTTGHPPDDKRVFFKMALGLRDLGANVTLVAPRTGNPNEDLGVRLCLYPVKQVRGERFLLRPRQLRRSCEGLHPDIWIACEPDSVAVALRLSSESGGKVLFDCHEDYAIQFRTRKKFKWIGWMLEPAIRYWCTRLARRCDGIISVSEGIKALFADLRTPQIVLRNMAKVADFRDGFSPPHDFKDPDHFYVLQNGANASYTGTTVLLKAIRLLKDQGRRVKLISFDAFGPGYSPQFHHLVRELDLKENITILPWMPQHKARPYLAAGDAGVILYQDALAIASLPNKAFDYMALGIPFVANSSSIHVEKLVSETGCGLMVDGEDPFQVAESLAYLADHPQDRADMGNRGRQAFLTRFNWESECTRLGKFIGQLE